MKRGKSFELTAALARAHASSVLALHPSAIGRAYALGEAAPVSATIPGAQEIGVAQLHIEGPLTQRATSNMCGFSDGYDSIAERFESAMGNPFVGAVVLVVDSPGGDCAGLFECVSKMNAVQALTKKPVFCYVDELAASAAYAIATVASGGIFGPRSAEIGSVGCIAIHCDATGEAEKEGLRYQVFRSGARKAEGLPIEPLTDVAAAALQERVNGLAGQFFEVVAGARGMTAEQVAALEGACFDAPTAQAKGLANGIATLDQVMAMAQSAATQTKESPMTAEEQAKMDDMAARLAKLEAGTSEGEPGEDEDGDNEDDEDEDEEDAALPPPAAAPPVSPAKKGSKLAKANAEIAALKAEKAKAESRAEIASLVRAAVKSGKVTPGKKAQTIALGEKLGKDGIELFIAALPEHPVASVTEEQKKASTESAALALTDEDKKVAAGLGMSEEVFAKGKAESIKKAKVSQ